MIEKITFIISIAYFVYYFYSIFLFESKKGLLILRDRNFNRRFYVPSAEQLTELFSIVVYHFTDHDRLGVFAICTTRECALERHTFITERIDAQCETPLCTCRFTPNVWKWCNIACVKYIWLCNQSSTNSVHPLQEVTTLTLVIKSLPFCVVSLSLFFSFSLVRNDLYLRLID